MTANDTPSEAYSQHDFMRTVMGLAKIAAAQAQESGLVNVSESTILSELAANLITCALVHARGPDLMVAITMKAERQAAEIMNNRAAAIQHEMDIAAKLNGVGWGRA